MIYDLLQQSPAAAPHRSDVCIVGAGAAGISLAVLLSRAGKQVTLLEGGGIAPDSENDCFQAGVSGLAYRGIREGRTQGLGGTTALWGGQILPLGDIDFEHRPWIAGSGWPICKADLLRFYQQALELEGLANTVAPDAAVWARIGAQPPAYPGMRTYLSRWCPEPDFAVLHADALRHDRIRVWMNARAVSLHRCGEAVRGVTVRTPAGAEHTFRAEQFIFCLGAIESSRFFLQEQEGSLPWNQSGLLGRHFQDHVDCDAATLVPRDPAALSRSFDAIYVQRQKYLPKLRLSESEQMRRSLLNVGGTVYTPQQQDSSQPLRQAAGSLLRGKSPKEGLLFSVRHLGQAPSLARQSFRYLVQHRGSLQTRRPLTLRVHCEQEPCGNSTIRLAHTKDRLGMQQVEVHWVIADRELQTIRGFVQTVAQALAPIAIVEPHRDLLRKTADFRTHCQDSFHHMGGMRMNASAHAGVVDTDLRLHGTANCFVCSTAVFPTSGFSNPTHTLLALTARLAEHISR
ncbi:FAD-dependent oxidoreductase [Terriglobus aquaticus]|uniref:FAD-dependent oxidoreductase n=1 Tax=Terriglobus aquaticus TaxID=940139 RepID=A0ABW9KHY4_9BACT|nr:GMC family oxidoreductase [Terriglobus aquaticus]